MGDTKLHRELLNPLSDAERYRKNNQSFKNALHDADGYYDIVNQIAERYGEKAYQIAEKVFEKNGMRYDPTVLRTPFSVRRTDYNLMGMNAFEVAVVPYEDALADEIRRMYNNQVLNLGEEYLIDSAFAVGLREPGAMFVAKNAYGQNLGFVHCACEGDVGSIEALIFLPGRIHLPAMWALLDAARAALKEYGAKTYIPCVGFAPWPHEKAVQGQAAVEVLRGAAPHIAEAVERFELK